MTQTDMDRYRIHSGTYWDTYVSDRGGNNLGRIYFWLKRDGIIDYDDLTDDERMELLQLYGTFKRALRRLFNFDGPLNFCYLANEEWHGHHCHYHVIPRYKEKREFMGVIFEDIAWGKLFISKNMDLDLAIAVGKAVLKEAQIGS